MNVEEQDKPPSGNINRFGQRLYDIGTLWLLCSGVGQNRSRTRLAWGLYCSGQSRVKDILEVDRITR